MDSSSSTPPEEARIKQEQNNSTTSESSNEKNVAARLRKVWEADSAENAEGGSSEKSAGDDNAETILRTLYNAAVKMALDIRQICGEDITILPDSTGTIRIFQNSELRRKIRENRGAASDGSTDLRVVYGLSDQEFFIPRFDLTDFSTLDENNVPDSLNTRTFPTLSMLQFHISCLIHTFERNRGARKCIVPPFLIEFCDVDTFEPIDLRKKYLEIRKKEDDVTKNSENHSQTIHVRAMVKLRPELVQEAEEDLRKVQKHPNVDLYNNFPPYEDLGVEKKKEGLPHPSAANSEQSDEQESHRRAMVNAEPGLYYSSKLWKRAREEIEKLKSGSNGWNLAEVLYHMPEEVARKSVCLTIFGGYYGQTYINGHRQWAFMLLSVLSSRNGLGKVLMGVLYFFAMHVLAKHGHDMLHLTSKNFMSQTAVEFIADRELLAPQAAQYVPPRLRRDTQTAPSESRQMQFRLYFFFQTCDQKQSLKYDRSFIFRALSIQSYSSNSGILRILFGTYTDNDFLIGGTKSKNIPVVLENAEAPVYAEGYQDHGISAGTVSNSSHYPTSPAGPQFCGSPLSSEQDVMIKIDLDHDIDFGVSDTSPNVQSMWEEVCPNPTDSPDFLPETLFRLNPDYCESVYMYEFGHHSCTSQKYYSDRGHVGFLGIIVVQDIAGHHHDFSSFSYKFPMVKQFLASPHASIDHLHDTYPDGRNYRLLQQLAYLQCEKGRFVMEPAGSDYILPPFLTGSVQGCLIGDFLANVIPGADKADDKRVRSNADSKMNAVTLEIRKHEKTVYDQIYDRPWNYYVLDGFMTTVLATKVGRDALDKDFLKKSIAGVFEYFRLQKCLPDTLLPKEKFDELMSYYKEGICAGANSYEDISDIKCASAEDVASHLNQFGVVFSIGAFMKHVLKTDADWNEIHALLLNEYTATNSKFGTHKLPHYVRLTLIENFNFARRRWAESMDFAKRTESQATTAAPSKEAVGEMS